MRLALIPPVSLISLTDKTDYQLMLPELVDKYLYLEMYKKHCSGRDPYKKSFVILDNGAAEGHEIAPTKLAELAVKIHVDEIVIPDTLTNAKETIEKAQAFYHDVVPPKNMTSLKFGIMFVVQGTTMAEVLKCADWALAQWWIDTIGVPRHMVSTLGDPIARVRIVNLLSGKPHCKPIHLLGGSPLNPMEIRDITSPWTTTQKFLRGMDTSMPFSFTYAGRKIDDGSITGKSHSTKEKTPTLYHDVVTRPSRYFDKMRSDFDSSLLADNVNALLRYSRNQNNMRYEEVSGGKWNA